MAKPKGVLPKIEIRHDLNGRCHHYHPKLAVLTRKNTIYIYIYIYIYSDKRYREREKTKTDHRISVLRVYICNISHERSAGNLRRKCTRQRVYFFLSVHFAHYLYM